jgi:hypothetical protein
MSLMGPEKTSAVRMKVIEMTEITRFVCEVVVMQILFAFCHIVSFLSFMPVTGSDWNDNDQSEQLWHVEDEGSGPVCFGAERYPTAD